MANSLILSLKIALILIGAISLAMLVKASIPLVLYELPIIWSYVMRIVTIWLKPPYLYVVINCIIIIIAATSRSGSNNENSSGSDGHLLQQPLVTSRTPPPSDLIAISQSEVQYSVVHSHDEVKVIEAVVENEPEVFDVMPVIVDGYVVGVNNHEGVKEEERYNNADEIAISEKSNELLLLPPMVAEKPLVASRFSHRKPPVKMSPEGIKALRVTRSKKPETLENTWKMITEGRHVPLTRHMKKSDTFHERHVTTTTAEAETENITAASPPQHHLQHRQVLKSETFKDRTNYDSPATSPFPAAAAELRKEPSPSADELNRRVEAFIKKFNEDMRLQRQQSIQKYMEMINRGV